MASTSGNREIARRYAAALFSLARESNQIDRLADDLRGIAGVVAESADFRRLMTSAVIRRADRVSAVRAVAGALKLSGLGVKFLGALAAGGRLAVLPAALEAAQAAIAAHRGEIGAEVTSARALDRSQAGSIAAALKKATGAAVTLTEKVDRSVMGGLVVRVGSRLIDASVRTRLERLTRALKSPNASPGKKRMKEVA